MHLPVRRLYFYFVLLYWFWCIRSWWTDIALYAIGGEWPWIAVYAPAQVRLPFLIGGLNLLIRPLHRIVELQDEFVQLKAAQILTVFLRHEIVILLLQKLRQGTNSWIPITARSQPLYSIRNSNPFWKLLLHSYKAHHLINVMSVFNVLKHSWRVPNAGKPFGPFRA